MTEVVEPETDAIRENQSTMAPITDLVTSPGKCKPEEQSGKIGKTQTGRNNGRATIQNGMVAVNEENLIPRLTRSKTADQALQAPDNLTLPIDKPCKAESVLIPIGSSKEAVEPDNLF
eukprot:9618629-Ditylum_brightwellii.AAC.1